MLIITMALLYTLVNLSLSLFLSLSVMFVLLSVGPSVCLLVFLLDILTQTSVAQSCSKRVKVVEPGLALTMVVIITKGIRATVGIYVTFIAIA